MRFKSGLGLRQKNTGAVNHKSSKNNIFTTACTRWNNFTRDKKVWSFWNSFRLPQINKRTIDSSFLNKEMNLF